MSRLPVGNKVAIRNQQRMWGYSGPRPQPPTRSIAIRNSPKTVLEPEYVPKHSGRTFTKKFTVSILTYCAVAHARKCVESVVATTNPDETEIILTANGSAGATRLFSDFASKHPNIRVVVNHQNLGFIEPNNLAFAQANGEYFVMLNDDCEVEPGWLEALYDPFVKFSKTAAIAGPRENASALRPSLHGYRTRGDPFEYIEFSCAMLSTRVFDEIGLFSPDLEFAYGEDADCCLRARRAGKTLHLVNTKIHHVGNATSKHVQKTRQSEQLNHEKMKERFDHYLRVREFGYPIVIKRRGAMGDVFLTTALIRTLKKMNPLSPIRVETDCPQVFLNNPHVQAVGKRVEISRNAMVFDLNMAYENRTKTHYVDAYADILGIKPVSRTPEIFISQADELWGEKVPEKSVAIFVGPTGWQGRDWPIDRWEKVASYLKNSGFNVVLVGSKIVGNFDDCLDFRNKTTIHQSAAILRACDAVLTIDSFPVHLAQAVGTPTLCLFGISSPEFVLTSDCAVGLCGDRSLQLSGIRHGIMGMTYIPNGRETMESISVDSVIDAFHALPKRPTSSARPQ